MTRFCSVLGVEYIGAPRLCDLNVDTIMVVITIFRGSILLCKRG